jgi:hypothetical protein
MSLIMCTPSNPGMSGDVYHVPYIESVEGYRHGYMGRNGVEWTRKISHPTDPRCPACAEMRSTA